jgi:hypothetical protein
VTLDVGGARHRWLAVARDAAAGDGSKTDRPVVSVDAPLAWRHPDVTRPLTDEEFARRLADLDPPALRTFVAALVGAADRAATDADPDGTRRAPAVSAETEPTVRVVDAGATAVPAPLRAGPTGSTSNESGENPDTPPGNDGDASETPPTAVAVVRSAPSDALAASAREHGVRLLDPPALRRLVLYAVPPATGDALCREHLGTPARVEGTAPAAGPIGAGSDAATPGREREPRGADRRRRPGDGEDGSGSRGWGRVRRAAAGGFVVGLAVALAVALATTGLPVLSASPDGGATLTDATDGAGNGSGGEDEDPASTGDAGATGATATPTPTATVAAGDGGPAVAPSGSTSVDRAFGGRNGTGSTNGSRYFALAPTCERPPGLVVAVQVAALGANDRSTADEGIETTYRFASPENRQFVGSFEDFRQVVRSETYRPLLAYESVTFEAVERSGNVATRVVTVRDANGTASSFEFTLVRQTTAQYDGCWMTEGVAPVGALGR